MMALKLNSEPAALPELGQTRQREGQRCGGAVFAAPPGSKLIFVSREDAKTRSLSSDGRRFRVNRAKFPMRAYRGINHLSADLILGPLCVLVSWRELQV
jgi:hypothetical protein